MFYAEDAASRKHLQPIISELVEGFGKKVCYVTSSAHDPILQHENDQIESFYIGLGSARTVLFLSLQAGLLAMTRTLGVELGPHGIRVNAVLPGFIDTPVHGDLLKDRVYHENYLKLIPLNRFGTSDDMANVIYFLASDQAAFITGQGIIADGGQISGQSYERVFGKRKSLDIRQEKND